MTIQVKIIEDSISEVGVGLTTYQLRYPRFIHSEFMTHRMFSRNASSSRAKPFYKWKEEIKNNLALPEVIHYNKPGMQGDTVLKFTDYMNMIGLIRSMAHRNLETLDVINTTIKPHKQVINRYLEPFTHIDVICTATEWDDFFKLRDHEDADPTIHKLASMMKREMELSTPKLLKRDEWHLPYVSEEEKAQFASKVLCNVSAARCARVSYSNHDGTNPVIAGDLELATKLKESGHMSPFEHQATPLTGSGVTHYDTTGDCWSGNFREWTQYRHVI